MTAAAPDAGAPVDSHAPVGAVGAVSDTIDETVIDIDTVIVGAGFAGLGMGIRLARRGEASFVILERGPDVGGTWRDNIYPGVACDIPSHLYSFSFRQNPSWSRFFAPGAEIQQYLRDSARDEGLAPHLRFGADVTSMRWDAAAERWLVTTASGSYRCRALIVAAGRLSEKRIPPVPGLEHFAGTTMHSSEWDPSVDLAGTRVGLVGTGASAIQLVPHLAATADAVVVFQRTAAYVVPRDDREYSAVEKRTFARDPGSMETLRSRLFWNAETAFAERVGTPDFVGRLHGRARAHLESQVADAQLRADLTPGYEIGCKRVLISSDFYPALQAPGVTLEPAALERIDVDGRAVSARGIAYDVDVLVFATGFETTRPPFAGRVFGRDGTRLSDHWDHGMAAFASTVVAGFPNLFVIDGPNASLGHNSAVYMIESQIDYVLGALDLMRTTGATTLEVTAEAERDYVRDLDRRSARTVWMTGGCHSWYVDDASGRLTLLWPDFAHAFRAELGRVDAGTYR